jgi:glycosyltransferase involved in cell wall biosynthesis
VIVVDDGSTDGTADAVRPFAERDSRVRLVSKRNEGLAAARNTALGMTEAPLVCFLDADDMWLPRYLEEMASALDSDPAAGVAYTDAWALDAVIHKFRKATAMANSQPPRVAPADPTEMMRLLVRQNFVWVSATVRRRAIEEAGLFRPDFLLTEDIELWFRILALGYRIVRAPGGVLGIKRQRPEALSRRELANTESLQRVMRLVEENDAIPSEVRRLAQEKRTGELERWRRALSGESRALAVWLATRRRLGILKRLVTDRYVWRDEPPPEVETAFPELIGPGR